MHVCITVINDIFLKNRPLKIQKLNDSKFDNDTATPNFPQHSTQFRDAIPQLSFITFSNFLAGFRML
jgi:hypothetical protein